MNKVPVASKGPFLRDMGHSVFLFFSLLPSTGAFFKFSPYNRALYTIKPSLTPPPRQLLVSDLETQVICHQRRGARGNSKPSTGAPHWALTALDAALQKKKSLNIAEQSSRGRRGWRSGVSVLPTACQSFSLLDVIVCVCALAYMCSPVHVFSRDGAQLGTKRR